METDKSTLLTELIKQLTPLNNKWRTTDDAIRKIEIMWNMGHEVDAVVKSSDFGFDELLRTLYDPHGKKMTYITRDLLSYSHRVYIYFESEDQIGVQLKGLKSYTLFREAFPLLTNDRYKLNENQKSEILNLIVNATSTKFVQKELKKIKQNIRPIKNSRVTKADQYSDVAKELADLKSQVVGYYKSNEKFNPETFPVDEHVAESLKTILLAIAFDRELVNKFDASSVTDTLCKQLAEIANSKSEDRARFKKWGLDTHALMSLAEMLTVLSSPDKYYFVRQKVVDQ